MSKGDRALLIRAEEADPDLPEGLGRVGVPFDDVPAYRTGGLVPGSARALGVLLRLGRVDGCLLYSPNQVERLRRIFSKDPPGGPGLVETVPAAVIGPKTEERARRAGFRRTALAERPTDASMIQALLSIMPSGHGADP